MSGADEFVATRLQWSAKMQADIRDGARLTLDTIDEHRATEKINLFDAIGRNLRHRTQWSFHRFAFLLHSLLSCK